MCCKTHFVASIEKPAGSWCNQCRVGRGCKIYANRPEECTDFRCQWLIGFGNAEMRPDRCGFVLDLVPLDGVIKAPEKLLILYEATEGSLEDPRATVMTRIGLLDGLFVAHQNLSGKSKFFLPPGVELSEEVERNLIDEETEIILFEPS